MRRSEPHAALVALLERERLPGLLAVYLFGSHAAGRAHRESDVDLGVLLQRELFPTRRERFEQRLFLISFFARHLASPVDVVVLDDAPPLLARRILTTGRRLFGTDPEAEHAFVRDVQLRAADLEPFLRRTRAIKLQALARR